MRKFYAMQKCKTLNIEEEYLSGKSTLDIQRETGIGHETIRKYLTGQGLNLRTISEALKLPNKSGHWKGKKRPEISKPLGSRRISKRGYVFIRTEEGWIQEHRIIMENILNRKLTKDEIVHHKDGDIQNNKEHNLCLMKHGEHSTYHNTGKIFSEDRKNKIGESKKKIPYYLQPAYKDISRDTILEYLSKCKHKTEVAKLLGITVKTLYNKIKLFNIYMEIHNNV